MRKPRKNDTPVEKVAILRRHLIDRIPVSDLCDEHQLSPTLFYLWQKQFFENGPAAFERKNVVPEGHLQRTIAALRDKLQRKNEVVAELMEEHIKLKKSLGSSERSLGSPRRPRLHHRLRPPLGRTHRDPCATLHRLARHRRQQVPRLEDALRIGQRTQRPGPPRLVARTVGEGGHPRVPPGPPLEGYRRLAFMMLDADIVAASPSSVYRVLRQAGAIKPRDNQPSKKGKGFQQPLCAHQHWHVDVTDINIAGTFFYLRSLLDGYSRLIVHWEIRESMTEPEVGTIIQRARASPANGPGSSRTTGRSSSPRISRSSSESVE
jgi:transposase-like protein